MSQTRNISGADMFCGGGGFSAGLLHACNDLGITADLTALNHWPMAIATHKLNHPGVNHLCEDLDNVDPRKAVPSGRLDIMLASPECTHFSRARGGTPMSDQSRSSAYHIHRWCHALRVDRLIIENVKEFQTWGPLNAKGRPIEHKKGQLFVAFCQTLEAMGYYVDFRVVNSAWYGAATSRERLFIQASKKRKPRWPERTHSATPNLMEQKPYRAAREIINWDHEGNSIFGRKKPLSDKTLKRIMAGLKKFGGVEFILGQQSCSAPRDLGQPIPTVSTAGAISLVEPFLVVLRNNADGRSLDDTLPTVCAGGGHLGLCQPFIVPVTHGGGAERSHDIEKPLPTITTAQRGELALCEPFLVRYQGERRPSDDERLAQSLDAPIGTLTTENRYALCEPFIIPQFSDARPRSVDEPLGVITTTSRGMALIEPYLVKFKGGQDAESLDSPMTTLTSMNCFGLAEPFITPYYGTAGAVSCASPLPTVTTNDRFGLCEPEPVAVFERDGVTYAMMDIRFRMLQPDELAAAMGMDGYQFTGTKSDQVKMIGNAVEVNTSRALCKVALQ